MSKIHDESHHDAEALFDDPGMALILAAVIFIALLFTPLALGFVYNVVLHLFGL